MLLAAVAFVLAACGDADELIAGQETPDDHRSSIHVVATTSILGDIAGNVLGEGHRIDVLMGTGVDPHAFEASAQQAALLREADVVVANGLDLEENLLDALQAAEEEGVEVFYVTDHVDVIDFVLDRGGVAHTHGDDGHAHADGDDGHAHGDDDDEHAGGDHDHGPEDPHVWQDPVRMSDAVIALGDHLAELDGDLSAEVQENASAYAEDLLEVHERNSGLLDEVPDESRKLVTSHDAMGYFADRYDFDVIGAVLPGGTTIGDPSSREFRDLVTLVDDERVPAVFAEVTEPTRLAEALSREVGHEVEVVVLFTDALGDEGSGAETYLGLLETNADRVSRALTP